MGPERFFWGGSEQQTLVHSAVRPCSADDPATAPFCTHDGRMRLSGPGRVAQKHASTRPWNVVVRPDDASIWTLDAPTFHGRVDASVRMRRHVRPDASTCLWSVQARQSGRVRMHASTRLRNVHVSVRMRRRVGGTSKARAYGRVNASVRMRRRFHGTPTRPYGCVDVCTDALMGPDASMRPSGRVHMYVRTHQRSSDASCASARPSGHVCVDASVGMRRRVRTDVSACPYGRLHASVRMHRPSGGVHASVGTRRRVHTNGRSRAEPECRRTRHRPSFRRTPPLLPGRVQRAAGRGGRRAPQEAAKASAEPPKG